MKKLFGQLVLLMFVIFPFNAFALGGGIQPITITNSNGVEMTLEEYTNLKKLFSDTYIDAMTQDEFDDQVALGLDYDQAQGVKKYIKTEYNHLTGQTTSTEITEAEYLSANVNPDPNANAPQATYIENAYKWIYLGTAPLGDYGKYFTFTAHWKTIPTTRSYDVIAARFIDLEVVNGTQSGKQFYTINNSNGYVNYSFNGTNINDLSNGFGISMNLLNDPDVTAFELEIQGCLNVLDYPAFIYASYQHAVSNTTLTESKNYTLSSIGLGSVIHFLDTSTISKYDGMEGVYTYFMS